MSFTKTQELYLNLMGFKYDFQITPDSNRDKQFSDSIFYENIYFEDSSNTLFYELRETGQESKIQFTSRSNREIVNHLMALDVSEMFRQGWKRTVVTVFKVNNQRPSYTIVGNDNEE